MRDVAVNMGGLVLSCPCRVSVCCSWWRVAGLALSVFSFVVRYGLDIRVERWKSEEGEVSRA